MKFALILDLGLFVYAFNSSLAKKVVMKNSLVGFSLSLLLVIIYFGTFSAAFAGPDITPPTLNPVSITSSNADITLARVGNTITLMFTADENIMTPVITIDGNAPDTLVEAPPNTWTATRVMQAGDTEAPIAFTIDFIDLAGNAGTTVTATTDASSVIFDETAPMITAGSITAGNTVTIVYDEPIISVIGDYANLMVGGPRAITMHGGSSTTTITLAFGGAVPNVDAVGTIDIGIAITDLAGNAITPVVGQALTDGQAPSLISVSIASDNADMTLAKVLDTVTLTFTSDEAIFTPTVSMVQIDGNDADSVMGGPTVFTATRQMMTGDNEGTIGFSINFTDDPAGNAGTTVTAITVGSNVTFDETPPILNPVSIISDNVDPVWARVGDTVTLTFIVNDALMMGPVVTIDGNAPDTLVEAPPNTWTATRVMQAGDTEAPIAFTIDSTDLAGNAGTQTTITVGSNVTFDETPPMATAGAIISNNDFAILYNEPVISVSGDYTDLIIGVTPKTVIASTTGSATIVLTFNTPPNSNADDTGRVDVLGTLTDLAGNPIVLVDDQVLDDGQTPTLNPVSIISDNADPVWAKVLDTVTLTFTSNEAMIVPVVTIDGNAPDTLVEAPPNTWTATRVMQAGDTDAPIAFTINFSDLVGNAGTQTTITVGSNVTFDEILPSITSSAVTSGRSVTILYDEPVITVVGDYSALVIGNSPRSIDSLASGISDTVFLTYSPILPFSHDSIGSITIGAGITDRAGNVFTPGTFFLVDGQPPDEDSSLTVGRGSAPSFSSSSSDSSITMSPISINGIHYNFIQSGNLLPIATILTGNIVSKESEENESITNVINVGQLTQLKFVTFTNLGPDHIQHVAIYTNLKGTSIKSSSDTIGIIYDKGKEIKIMDRNSMLSHADIKVSGEGNRVDINVDIIFSENMDTSDLVLKMWDANRYPLYAHIKDAWKVVGKTELEDLSASEESIVEIISENPIKEIQKEEMISAIKKWAGYDLVIIQVFSIL